MSRKNSGKTGGFVFSNYGEISDCYTAVSIKSFETIGAFCNENFGIIKNSYSKSFIKGNSKFLFSRKNEGKILSCFYDAKAGGKDASKGRLNKFSQKELMDWGWDFSEIWKYDNTELTFKETDYYVSGEDLGNFIRVSSAAQLILICEKINQGDDAYRNGKYILTRDINLRGKKWTPMGIDSEHPFSGVFDGAGHVISNFVVKDKELECSGFFGYLKEALVYNLAIDCEVKTGKFAGAIAGVNDGGKIISCCTASKIFSNKYSGGFVGKNTGMISKCFAVGKLSAPLFLSFSFLILLATLLLLVFIISAAAMYSYIKSQQQASSLAQVYPPIPSGKTEKFENANPNTERNQVSFKFDTEVKCKEGKAYVWFENPGTSNNYIVVKLQMTDEDLIKKFGKTCRTAAEQAKLNNDPNYDPKTSRLTIGESGAIKPGYRLDYVDLMTLPDGTKLTPGEYDVILHMENYDMGTNEKAMIRNQSRITLNVQ